VYARMFFLNGEKICPICRPGLCQPMINNVFSRDIAHHLHRDKNFIVLLRDKGLTTGAIKVPERVYQVSGPVYSVWPLRHSDGSDYDCKDRLTAVERIRVELENNCAEIIPSETRVRAVYHTDQLGAHFHFTAYSMSPSRFIRLSRKHTSSFYSVSPMMLDLMVRCLNFAFRLITSIKRGEPVKLKKYCDIPLPIEVLLSEASDHTHSASKGLCRDIITWYLVMYATLSVHEKIFSDVGARRFTVDDIWYSFEAHRNRICQEPVYLFVLEQATLGRVVMFQSVYRMWGTAYFPYNLHLVQVESSRTLSGTLE
jgi:hypothetical protein